jgi:hypothetical protein
MTRSILCGLLAVLSVGALGVVPVACQSGGVGDPCTPEDEYNSQFPGFKVQEENIESRSFQCATRICLVNHFQGRVSCPLGQGQPQQCNGTGDTSCGADAECVESQVYSPECTVCDGKDPSCQAVLCPTGLTCDAKRNVCLCASSAQIAGVNYNCELADPKCTGGDCPQVLRSYLCHKKNNCQNGANTATQNNGKDCCIPGTDTPVGVPVCGQCDANSKRNADQAVYCSCRCCPKCCDDPSVTDDDKKNGRCEMDKTLCGTACDPNFNYCNCPTGFSCSEIRKNVGLGDVQLTGSYCIKDGSAYTTDANCGNVQGYFDPTSCKGASIPTVGGGDGG